MGSRVHLGSGGDPHVKATSLENRAWVQCESCRPCVVGRLMATFLVCACGYLAPGGVLVTLLRVVCWLVFSCVVICLWSFRQVLPPQRECTPLDGEGRSPGLLCQRVGFTASPRPAVRSKPARASWVGAVVLATTAVDFVPHVLPDLPSRYIRRRDWSLCSPFSLSWPALTGFGS